MINNDQETYKKYIEEIGNLIFQDSKVDNLSLEELEELKDYQSKCYSNIDKCLEIINNIPTQDKLDKPQELSYSNDNHNILNKSNEFNNSENNLDKQFRSKFEDINNKVDLLNSKIDIKEQTIQEQNLRQFEELNNGDIFPAKRPETKRGLQKMYISYLPWGLPITPIAGPAAMRIAMRADDVGRGPPRCPSAAPTCFARSCTCIPRRAYSKLVHRSLHPPHAMLSNRLI